MKKTAARTTHKFHNSPSQFLKNESTAPQQCPDRCVMYMREQWDEGEILPSIMVSNYVSN